MESTKLDEARQEVMSSLSTVDDLSYVINTDHNGMLITADEVMTHADDVIFAGENLKRAAEALQEAEDEDEDANEDEE